MERKLDIMIYLLERLVAQSEGREVNEIINEVDKFFPKPQRVTPKGEPIDKEAVDRIYALYPTKCPVGGRSTGKSAKDKAKIARLLLVNTEEALAETIKRYLEESVNTKTYIKNFGTFLNNIPDFGEQTIVQEEEPRSEGRNAFDLVGDW